MNRPRGILFAAFGAGLAAVYVRVVRPWALRWGATGQEVARSLPGDEVVSLFITRTRAAATDPQSRKKFRRYWAPMSAGIILIRYAAPPQVKKQAERQARQADKAGLQTAAGHGQ